MSILGRRPFLKGGLGLFGAGTLAWGGSVAVCSLTEPQEAIIRSLFAALDRLPDPGHVGRAWLAAEGPEQIIARLLVRPDLVGQALLPDAEDRQHGLAALITTEFRSGDIVVAGSWVVARTEAEIAGAWVALQA